MLKRLMGYGMVGIIALFLISSWVNYRGFTFLTAGIVSPIQVFSSGTLLLLSLLVTGLSIYFRHENPEALEVMLVFWGILTAAMLLLVLSESPSVLLVLCMLPWWGLGILEAPVFRYGFCGICVFVLAFGWMFHFKTKKDS